MRDLSGANEDMLSGYRGGVGAERWQVNGGGGEGPEPAGEFFVSFVVVSPVSGAIESKSPASWTSPQGVVAPTPLSTFPPPRLPPTATRRMVKASRVLPLRRSHDYVWSGHGRSGASSGHWFAAVRQPLAGHRPLVGPVDRRVPPRGERPDRGAARPRQGGPVAAERRQNAEAAGAGLSLSGRLGD